jgi:hypothetical protein
MTLIMTDVGRRYCYLPVFVALISLAARQEFACTELLEAFVKFARRPVISAVW